MWDTCVSEGVQVDYTGFSTINAQRFGQKFVGKVANPHDIVLWHKAPIRKAKVGETAMHGLADMPANCPPHMQHVPEPETLNICPRPCYVQKFIMQQNFLNTNHAILRATCSPIVYLSKTSPQCRNAFLLSPSISECRFPV